MGIDVQAISAAPAGSFYWADPEFARMQNDNPAKILAAPRTGSSGRSMCAAGFVGRIFAKEVVEGFFVDERRDAGPG